MCRFIEGTTVVGGMEMNMNKLNNNEQICIAPRTDYVGEARLELSANGQQWQDSGSDVKFYNGPKVTAVNPTYGETKNPRGLNLTIYGDNFECPNGDCKHIKVRFTNDRGDHIFEDGSMFADRTVTCVIPRYPAPETLAVDVSFNAQDYTNDNVKYGFMDPFILNITPRLVSVKGTTVLDLSGYGFVQMDDTKSVVALKSHEESLTCKDGLICTKVYRVLDEHHATVTTYEQSGVSRGANNIGWQSWNVYMMNPDGDYTPNKIDLFYYYDIVLQNVSS
jgi:hypothetical protein